MTGRPKRFLGKLGKSFYCNKSGFRNGGLWRRSNGDKFPVIIVLSENFALAVCHVLVDLGFDIFRMLHYHVAISHILCMFLHVGIQT